MRKGFTLIELLVVIAVIGLLSSIVLVSLKGVRAKTRDARRLSDMKQILLALELYYDTYGQYPGYVSSYGESGSCGGWDSSSEDTDGDGKFFIEPLQEAGFMGIVPRDPLDPPSSQASCGRYAYFRYPPGSGGCDSSRGPFFVLGVRDMETTGRPHPSSPGWSCPGYNWQNIFDWVVGGFEK